MNDKEDNGIYLNDWTRKEDVVRDFCNIYQYDVDYKQKVELAILSDEFNVNILLASYGYENYSGDAFVLFEKDGKLYEVNAAHCSCYGLEDQWSPEETSVEALEFRLNEGTLGNETYCGNVFATELRLVLAELKIKNDTCMAGDEERKGC